MFVFGMLVGPASLAVLNWWLAEWAGRTIAVISDRLDQRPISDFMRGMLMGNAKSVIVMGLGCILIIECGLLIFWARMLLGL